MFTGIVSDIGTALAVEDRGDLRARIACAYRPETIALGASIACAGICPTVGERGVGGVGSWLAVDVSAETRARSNIAHGRTVWRPGARINLERALRVGDELGGHIVSGHVDGTAEIVAIAPEGASLRVTLRAPAELARFIAPKGSVALDGVSLTVNEVAGERFGINLIPHTRSATTWGEAATGDLVNLEIDTLARYVARLRETEP
ncbi:riboflavin synthase [soil metagenome]